MDSGVTFLMPSASYLIFSQHGISTVFGREGPQTVPFQMATSLSKLLGLGSTTKTRAGLKQLGLLSHTDPQGSLRYFD